MITDKRGGDDDFQSFSALVALVKGVVERPDALLDHNAADAGAAVIDRVAVDGTDVDQPRRDRDLLKPLAVHKGGVADGTDGGGVDDVFELIEIAEAERAEMRQPLAHVKVHGLSGVASPGLRCALPGEIGRPAGTGKGDRAVVILPDEVAEDLAVAVGMDGPVGSSDRAADGAGIVGIPGVLPRRGDDRGDFRVFRDRVLHILAAVNAAEHRFARGIGVDCSRGGVAVRGHGHVAGHVRAVKGPTHVGEYPGVTGRLGQGDRAVCISRHRLCEMAGADEGHGVGRRALVRGKRRNGDVVFAERVSVLPDTVLLDKAFARVAGIDHVSARRKAGGSPRALRHNGGESLKDDRKAFPGVQQNKVVHRDPEFVRGLPGLGVKQRPFLGGSGVRGDVPIDFEGISAAERFARRDVGQVLARLRGKDVSGGGAGHGVQADHAVMAVSVFAVRQRRDLVGRDLRDGRVFVRQPEIPVVAPVGAPGVFDQPRAVMDGARILSEVFAAEIVVPADDRHGVVDPLRDGTVVRAELIPEVILLRIIAAREVTDLHRAVFGQRRLDRGGLGGIGMDRFEAEIPLKAVVVKEGLLHRGRESGLVQAFVQIVPALERRSLVVQHGVADDRGVAAPFQNVVSGLAGHTVVPALGYARVIAVIAVP